MTDKKQTQYPGCPNCAVVMIGYEEDSRFESLRDFKVLAQPVPWRGGVEIWIGAVPVPSTDKIAVIDKIIWKESVNDDSDDAPLTLTYQAAQKLIDDLWNCGLRPGEGSGSAGALKATQGHLEDMRKLVFEKGK